MADGGPSLSLFELIHPMSPSPAPQIPEPTLSAEHPSFLPEQTQPLSPEPLQDTELAQMRHRVSELDVESIEMSDASPREKELARMVLRLTDLARPDSEQLLYQAELIVGLKAQRDLILKQAEEERARFDVERDGWDRMAEVLIAQRNRGPIPISKVEELERQYAAVETDNKHLREKLSDTQSRLASLENELVKLRPILLMQPLGPTATGPSNSKTKADAVSTPGPNAMYLSSFPYPPVTGSAALSTHKTRQDRSKSGRPKEMKVPPPLHNAEEEENEAQGANAGSSKAKIINPYTLPATLANPAENGGPYAHLRHHTRTANIPTAPNPPSVSGPSGPAFSPKRTRNQTKKLFTTRDSRMPPPSPISSDARNEHLLLAARKIGKERVNILAGIVSKEAERERQREKEKEEQEKKKEKEQPPPPTSSSSHYRNHNDSPKTPKRSSASGPAPPAHPPAGPFPVPMSYYAPLTGPNASPRGGMPTHMPYVYFQGPGGAPHGAVMIPYAPAPAPAPAPSQPQPTSRPPPPSQPPQPPAPPPAQQKAKAKGKGKQQPKKPPSSTKPAAKEAASASTGKNALDSLLDAARSIENSQKDDGPTAGSRRRSVEQPPGSPKAKRPRLSGPESAASGRIRSALDLLADEAAFHSASLPATPAGASVTRAADKKKDRARAHSKSSSSSSSISGEGSLATSRPTRTRVPPKERRMIAESVTPTRRASKPRMIEPPNKPASRTGSAASNTNTRAGSSRPTPTPTPSTPVPVDTTTPQTPTVCEPTSAEPQTSDGEKMDVVVPVQDKIEAPVENTVEAPKEAAQPQQEPTQAESFSLLAPPFIGPPKAQSPTQTLDGDGDTDALGDTDADGDDDPDADADVDMEYVNGAGARPFAGSPSFKYPSSDASNHYRQSVYGQDEVPQGLEPEGALKELDLQSGS